MIDIILSHWAMYLLLTWLIAIGVIGIVSLWPKKKSASPPESARFALRDAQRESAKVPFKDAFKLAQRER